MNGTLSGTLHDDAITIKGRENSVAVHLGDGNWVEMLDLLHARLVQSNGFFIGGQVALDLGSRRLQISALREIQGLFREHQMTLVWIRSSAEATCQSATDLGLMAIYVDSHVDGTIGDTISENTVNEEAWADSSLPPDQDGVHDRHLQLEAGGEDPLDFVYRGHLRSGQVVKRVETIVVIGDVKPGATVISAGDILVWGRLRGVAHAGVMGNTKAIVCALDLSPTQLRIAGITAQLSDWAAVNSGKWFRRQVEQLPQVAHVVNKKVAIKPLDQSKPSGLALLHNNG